MKSKLDFIIAKMFFKSYNIYKFSTHYKIKWYISQKLFFFFIRLLPVNGLKLRPPV